MKFLHLADLHLGKRVNGFSMLEDQAYILRQILTILDDERPDGVLIAGDVYDKPVPPTEAVELLDGFLTELCARGVPVPLKYSFSEASQHKSVTVVTLGEKGAVDVRTVPLTPLRDLREIRGSYDELTARSFYEHTTYRSDYLHLILTDEQDVFDAVGRLRAIYPYLMTLDYDNARTRAAGAVAAPAAMEQRTPLELFEALYLQQNNQPMSDEQRAFAAQLMEEIQEAQP